MTAVPRILLALKPEPKAKQVASPDKVMVAFRVSPALRDDLERLAKFWTRFDRAYFEATGRGGDIAATTTMTDVVVRLLESGIAGAWDEIGGKPGSKRDEDALIARLVAKLTK